MVWNIRNIEALLVLFYGSTLNGDSLLFSLTKGLNPNNGLSGGLSSSLNPLEQNSLATDKDKNALVRSLYVVPHLTNRDNILLRKKLEVEIITLSRALGSDFENFWEVWRTGKTSVSLTFIVKLASLEKTNISRKRKGRFRKFLSFL